MCKSNSGQFRVYKAGTYTVADTENGWNIWWTDKGHSEATAFHLAKCNIKDDLK